MYFKSRKKNIEHVNACSILLIGTLLTHVHAYFLSLFMNVSLSLPSLMYVSFTHLMCIESVQQSVIDEDNPLGM